MASKVTKQKPRHAPFSSYFMFTSLTLPYFEKWADTCSSVMVFGRPPTKIFSACSLTCEATVSTASLALFIRGSSFTSPSFAYPWDRACDSKYRSMVLSATCASCTDSSASLTALSEPSPASPPAAPEPATMYTASPETAALAFETFSSVSAILFSASSKILLTASRCSTDVKSFLCLLTSVCAVLSRVWNLISSALISTEASLPLASICLAVTNFRTSVSASLASFSHNAVFSFASRISSEDMAMSFSSSAKMLAASFILSTLASAFVTRLSASLTSAMHFRLEMLPFSSARRAVATSRSFWYSCSFSVARWAGPLENLLTSRVFIWMNIRAMDDAVCAAAAAASEDLTAWSESNRSLSEPSWNWPSASSSLARASVTVWTLSDASSM
mmetsp:Transcript_126194/g.356879  ORF Transcript_126194/g.356879 Transcript_126194/m.356879 type:complete len:389 (-) Transcript_126194:2020-3186(-)